MVAVQEKAGQQNTGGDHHNVEGRNMVPGRSEGRQE